MSTEKRSFMVTLIKPEGVSEEELRDYILQSIVSSKGNLGPEYPIWHLDGRKVKVVIGSYLEDKIGRLEDINFELGENLKAAEDKNHYLQLSRRMRNEVEEIRKKAKIMAEWILFGVEESEYGEEAFEDCAYLEACGILGRKPKVTIP